MSALQKIVLAVIVAAASFVPVACGPASVHVAASVAPSLVWVAPGIWVVENHPYAVYYADGYYWRYWEGGWYRSSYYDDGFALVQVGIVPRIVVGAYRPIHVRYRAPARGQVRPIARDHRSPRRHR